MKKQWPPMIKVPLKHKQAALETKKKKNKLMANITTSNFQDISNEGKKSKIKKKDKTTLPYSHRNPERGIAMSCNGL